MGHFLAHHAADRALDVRFQVFLVDPDIADVRESEGDDLRGVGGIGHDLLIAGHRGVEAHFAHCRAFGPETVAPQRRSVGEHEDSRRARGLRRKRRGGVGHFGALRKQGSSDVAKGRRLDPCPRAVNL
jgi:hypothetical protein